MFTLPPVPFGIQRRCPSQGKSHSSAWACSGASERPPPDRTPLLQECRDKTCPEGGDGLKKTISPRNSLMCIVNIKEELRYGKEKTFFTG